MTHVGWKKYFADQESEQLHCRLAMLDAPRVEDVETQGSHEQRGIARCYLEHRQPGLRPDVLG